MAATRQAPILLRHIRRLAGADSLAQLADRELLRRFTVGRDEAAFAALVRRHGAMVLHVGQRVLHNRHDAEDVFQATFLVLTRKAASLRWHESVGNWLYQVAYRIAQKSKVSAARRGLKEARAAERPLVESRDDLSWREVEALLDEELQRLPVKYRVPLVFCYLEGSTRDEAAQQLGWSLSTLKRRLERGRELLRLRLVRRGLTLSAALFAPMLTQSTTKAALAPGLVQATVRSALQLAAGGSATGSISAQVAALVEGGLKTMLLTKTKIAGIVLFALGLLAAGAGTLAHQAVAAKETPPVAQKAEPTAKGETKPQAARTADAVKDKEGDTIAFSGRVLDPNGKPFAGAKLYVLYNSSRPLPVSAVCDADGRFQFSVARNDFVRSEKPMPWEDAKVVAVARGYGLGLAPFRLGKPTPRTDLTVRLAKDDAPLNGRIVDLQGKPVAGVTIRVRELYAPFGDDLAAFVKGVKDRKEFYPPLLEQTFGFHGGPMLRDIGSLFALATTGADGRFEIKGIGRERVVELRIEGPAIVTLDVYAMTRPADTIQAPGYKRYLPNTDLLTMHGNGFEHVAAPCKPIVGVVRDKDTGKPIPGAIVTSYKRAGSHISAVTDLRAVADREGRYRLMGMPKGEGNVIRAGPPDNEPYLMAVQSIADTPGFEPITADFTLKRGVWIAGRVLDKVTGAPLHAQVQYAVFDDNPNRKDAPGLSVDHYLATNAQDGKFRTVGLPGRGLIAARALNDRYLLGVGADKINGQESNGRFRTYPHLVYAQGYHLLMELNPAADAKLVTCDLLLDPGRTLKGKVLGPDGEPLAGVKVCGLRSYGGHGTWEYNPLQASEFLVTGLEKGKTRLLQFVHFEKKLAGSLVVKDDDKGPVTVKLAAAATLTGRLVTPEGEPIKDGELTALSGPIGEPDVVEENPAVGSLPADVSPDKDGKFRIQGVIPGLTYILGYSKANYLHRLGGAAGGKLTIKPGETKGLGDVVVKPIE